MESKRTGTAVRDNKKKIKRKKWEGVSTINELTTVGGKKKGKKTW